MGSRWWLLLPRPIRRLPADLAAIGMITSLTMLTVLLPVGEVTPLRLAVSLLFVIFVPGYAFVAALFPGTRETALASDQSDASGPTGLRSGIDGTERVVFAVGTSVAIVSLTGFALSATPWGVNSVPIVVSTGGFTFVAITVAARRRWSLDPAARYRTPFKGWIADVRAELFAPNNRLDAALNVFLVCSVLLAVLSVGYAVSVPRQEDSFSEFYLLTETDDGDLVADGYPTEFIRGEPRSLIVGITNSEHQQTNYTVVVQLQRVERENGSATAVETERVEEYSARLAHGETWRLRHVVAPEMIGTHLRLTYLLYRGTPPASPTVDNAYRSAHLWIDVTAPSTADD